MESTTSQGDEASPLIPQPAGTLISIFALIAFLVLATLIVGSRGFFFSDNQKLDHLSAGDVAPFDIVAPRDASFESTVLTEQRRQEDASVVRNVYRTEYDIARRQINRARLIVDYIEHVRNDPFASAAQKGSDLSAIQDLTLTNETIAALLAFSDAEWQRVSEQTVVVLGEVMSEDVREDTLASVRDTVPRRSVFLPVEQEAVVSRLVTQLIRPNTFVDPVATQAARDNAMASVPSVVRSFRQGQVVVSGGQVLTEADMEALVKLGLLHAGRNNGPELAAAFIAVLLSVVMVGFYANRFRVRHYEETRITALFGLFFLAALALARLMIGLPGREIVAYLYPAAAVPLIVTALVGPQLAMLIAFVLALLVGIIAGSVEMVALAAIGSVVAALSLRCDARINAFFVSGTLAGVANAAVILAFGLTEFNPNVLDLLVSAGIGLVSGMLSAALALAGLFLVGSVFNVTTGLMLAELARADHPLQQSLMRKAPGTYQHSLLVANMAENAAEAIGANVLLVRVGALYHDIGKMYNPIMFVENQPYGDNIHDRLDPALSAQYIIRHVPEGDRMGRKYRLPRSVRDFIWQHHGTTKVWFFLHKANEQANGDETAISLSDFTYPGPRPQSRETAVVMIADSCESAVRAMRSTGEDVIRELVEDIVRRKVEGGQFDDAGLTLADLKKIVESCVTSLRGVFHPRIVYPSGEKDREPAPVLEPARSSELTGIELAAAEMAALKAGDGAPDQMRKSAGFRRAFVDDQERPQPDRVSGLPRAVPSANSNNGSPNATEVPDEAGPMAKGASESTL